MGQNKIFAPVESFHGRIKKFPQHTLFPGASGKPGTRISPGLG